MKGTPTMRLRLVKSRHGELAGAYSVYGHYTLQQAWEVPNRKKKDPGDGYHSTVTEWRDVEIVELSSEGVSK